MEKHWYFAARLPIGFSLFGHGFVRLFKLREFHDWMVETMQPSFILPSMVSAFAKILPFAEFLIGLLILLGFLTRQALYAAILLMCLLIMGSSSIENWDAISSQLLHAGYLAFLLYFVRSNSVAFDKLFERKEYG